MDAENRVFTAWNDSENHGESPPVKLVTKVVQDKLPKEFRIRWYAHDIDDPAKHVHIDPNDKFPKEPRLPGEVDGYLVSGRKH